MVEISSQQLRSHVVALAETIGERNVFRPRALEEAARYIESEWRGQGYAVSSLAYRVEGVESRNLEVTAPGSGDGGEILLIGAHYDSVLGSPGANDNASGVAALLELSRRLSGARTRHSLRFVAFVNEEPPFFYWDQMGSMVYAKAARKRGDEIALMLSLETIGYYSRRAGSQRYPPFLGFFYPDRGDFIGFVSNLRSRRWLRRAVAAFRAGSDFPMQSVAMFEFVPGIGWSDHLSFWRQGYPALMVTDTAPYRYPWYHRAEDTPEKLDYESLARVTEGLYRMILSLAN